MMVMQQILIILNIIGLSMCIVVPAVLLVRISTVVKGQSSED